MDKNKRDKKDKYLNVRTIITIIVELGCLIGLILFKDYELKHLCVITCFIWESALLRARINRLEEIEEIEEGEEEK